MDCKTEVQSASALTGLRRFSSNQTLLERCLPSERDDQDAILAIAEDSHKKRDEDRASDWMSSHLMRNPPEVLERIFILASNGKLAYVNRKFNQIANSTLIRALWLIERYGPEKVLSLCWRWRFLRRLHMEDTTAAVTKDQREWKVHVEVCARKAEWLIGPQSCLRKRRSGKPCHCQRMAALADGIQQVHTDTWWTKARRRLNFHLHERRGEQVTFRRGESLISSERVKAATFLFSCEIEQTQILMVLQLLELGASVGAGCDMALRVAARWGHLNLMTVLLERGADPNTIVFFERTVGIKIKNKGKVGGGVPGDKKFVMDPPIALIDFQNQILVDAGLIAPPIPPPPPPSPEELEAMMEFRRNFSKYHQVPLLLQAVQASHTRLAKLLLSTDGPRPRGITNKTVTMALKEALELNKLDICNVLVEYGKVQPSADMIQSLVSRAGMWRLLCGLRNKLTHLIVFAVNNLSEEDFTAMSASLIRSSAEIGSVEFREFFGDTSFN
ncbi:hypothetical protein BC830DRAFT_586045 [Chytriomyces sp. MP71]|nr:hypothetical protein BC830DRAFT_586045 [Chytriomyces sp. MP71]